MRRSALAAHIRAAVIRSRSDSLEGLEQGPAGSFRASSSPTAGQEPSRLPPSGQAPYMRRPDSGHVDGDLEAVREEGSGAPSVWFLDIIAAPMALTFLRDTVERTVRWLLCPYAPR